MRAFVRFLVVVIALAVAALVVGVAYVRVTGLTAKAEPSAVEARAARFVRSLAVPADVRGRRNPVAASAEALADGLAHYADHCASCHGNDGSGSTEMGRGLYPKAPDMRLAMTQQLSDGELFYIIENGIRFTGMPGWSNGTQEGEDSTWRLVHFIRHLPQITPEEVERIGALAPRSPEEIRQELEEERFLRGDAPAPSPSSTGSEHTGAHK
jgi:mono/diheme cytochrome c family protein